MMKMGCVKKKNARKSKLSTEFTFVPSNFHFMSSYFSSGNSNYSIDVREEQIKVNQCTLIYAQI